MTAPAYQLVLRAGPTPGAVFTLDKGNLFIGRDLGNDIVINDAEVSRRHARLVMQGDTFVLEDLGSTNGTSVNGQKLSSPVLLTSGDAITFGEKVMLDFELVLTNPDATVVAPRPAPAPVPLVQSPPAQTPQYQAQPPQPRQQPVSPPVMPPPQPIRQAPVPPPQSYSGYVPAGPAPLAPAPPKRKFPVWIIILIVAILLLVCVCGVAAYYIDQNYLWCKVLPFLPGCS